MHDNTTSPSSAATESSTAQAMSQGVAAAADAIVDDIVALVDCETHSYDRPALDKGLDLLAGMATDRLGEPDERTRYPGGEHGDTLTLTYRGTSPVHVALVGHYDTVWPTGTASGWGARTYRDDSGRDRLSGPGVFDMKAGLVQGLWALRLLRESGQPTPTVTLLFNGDEEIGSLASRPVIEQVARAADATLVLEPSVDGAVKTSRKGIGIFTVNAAGVESHAGLDPEAGASAVHALAEFITAAVAAADSAAGTTINAGRVQGGSGTNVVAGHACAGFDIRVATAAEQQRVDAAFDAIKVSDPRVRIRVDHGWNRPPMRPDAGSRQLLQLARSAAEDLGWSLADVAVGGASDANFVAALERPVLCGLGAVGGGAHARGEFVYPDTVPAQTALVAGLLRRLGTQR